MHAEIEQSNRRLVVIVDPHIKVSDEYPLYVEGKAIESKEKYNVSNIFVKKSDGITDYQGLCWPGTSVWLDVLNEHAQDFWVSWFSYDKFKGSNHLYYFWNDMNEPATFNGPGKTLPLDSLHFKKTGHSYAHRDVHNAYGALH